MERRDFLKKASQFTLSTGAVLWVPARVFARTASLLRLSSDELRPLVDSFQGQIVLETDADYEQLRGGFNRRIVASPTLVALCSSDADVAIAVTWARAQGMPIRIRGGGHSYEGLSSGPGIVIDTRRMKRITVDPSTRYASIQAGARLGEVQSALAPSGLALPAGSCPTVGVAGLTLGGGFGLLSRQYGLTCDHLDSLRMIDAEGRTIHASLRHEPELFWASRGGGGGNFGIVTSLTFRLRPIDCVSVFKLEWKREQAVDAFLAWQDFAPHADRRLTSEFILPATGTAVKSVGQFNGPANELEDLLTPLTEVTEKQAPKLEIREVPFLEAVSYFGGGMEAKPIRFKAKSDYVHRPWDASTVRKLLEQMKGLKGASGWIQFDAYGGAMNDKGRTETAFYHRRDPLFSMQYEIVWNQDANPSSALQWLSDLYGAMREHVSGYSYVNYCDLDLGDWPNAYYGENLERLKKAKALYDPNDVFRHAQSVPLPDPIHSSGESLVVGLFRNEK